jgi:uncharacterized protein YehS (DUF1456 family)
MGHKLKRGKRQRKNPVNKAAQRKVVEANNALLKKLRNA